MTEWSPFGRYTSYHNSIQEAVSGTLTLLKSLQMSVVEPDVDTLMHQCSV
jgi:hypothetical protein